ncbi:MAG: tyrosine--tRNA ligase [Candidatus Terrybacteria bacterium]|nr:tyrosine--tRNA ligase [Candidatus Terrybacteria bacterium]
MPISRAKPIPEHIVQNILMRGVRVSLPQRNAAAIFISAKRPLRVKYGIDPTQPALTLGHLTVLRKLRLLQEYGHIPVLLIGDFTARFGDPTEKLKARVLRRKEDVAKAAAGYRAQIGRVLDLKSAEFRGNGEWYDRMSAEDLLRLESSVTAMQVLERDMFRERQKKRLPIGLYELAYPILQGYDSVMLRSDATVIGKDQLFNELMGRALQERFHQTPQAIFGVELLVGSDGSEKMSQSMGNAIALTEPPTEQFGRIMAVPDSALPQYAELLTDLPLAQIERNVRRGGVEARDAKARVAEAIVAQIHGVKAAAAANRLFTSRFRHREQPSMEQVREWKIAKKEWAPVELLVKAKLAPSHAQAQRLVEQGGVRLDGVTIRNPRRVFQFKKKEHILSVGKHTALRIIFTKNTPPR